MFFLAGDPHNIPTATGDPFKTLFVARIVSVTIEIIFLCLNLFHYLISQHVINKRWTYVTFQNYDTSESKLRREFEVYGPIKKVRICNNIYGWRHDEV